MVSESVPHLRRGVLRDWMAILGQDYDPELHHKTDEVFTVGKCMVEFFAVDHPDKARGGRRDFLFINECNRIAKDMRDQLEVRTRLKEFLDFNPTSRFWAHEMLADKGVWFDQSTYNDAKDGRGNWLIDESIRTSIESRRKTNPNWYKVYGLGEIGSMEGLIIPDFELVDKIPPVVPTWCGMDFGYSNDPSVLLEVGMSDGAIWINQLFYSTGMTNPAIVAKMREKKVPSDYLVYADCAEPKSIREIHDGGYYNIKPCLKGTDCFKIGVDYLRRYKIKVTKNSLETIRDFRNATWESDINGKYMNKPKGGFLHAIDAAIYSMTNKIIPPATVRGGYR